MTEHSRIAAAVAERGALHDRTRQRIDAFRTKFTGTLRRERNVNRVPLAAAGGPLGDGKMAAPLTARPTPSPPPRHDAHEHANTRRVAPPALHDANSHVLGAERRDTVSTNRDKLTPNSQQPRDDVKIDVLTGTGPIRGETSPMWCGGAAALDSGAITARSTALLRDKSIHLDRTST